MPASRRPLPLLPSREIAAREQGSPEVELSALALPVCSGPELELYRLEKAPAPATLEPRRLGGLTLPSGRPPPRSCLASRWGHTATHPAILGRETPLLRREARS